MALHKPGAWAGAGIGVFPRVAVVFLIVGVGLLVYVDQLFVAGRIDPEAGEGEHILIAFDHAMFLGVMTNALLGVAASVLARVYDGRSGRWRGGSTSASSGSWSGCWSIRPESSGCPRRCWGLR